MSADQRYIIRSSGNRRPEINQVEISEHEKQSIFYQADQQADFSPETYHRKKIQLIAAYIPRQAPERSRSPERGQYQILTIHKFMDGLQDFRKSNVSREIEKMKEFVYTCENCGTEYTITDPGKYQCSNCNNTFTVEDQEQKQAEKLEQIRRKAAEESQASTMQPIQNIQSAKYKKIKGEIVRILLIIFTCFIALSFAIHSYLFIQDCRNSGKRIYFESLKNRLGMSTNIYQNDIMSSEKEKKFYKDLEEFNKFIKENGVIIKHTTGTAFFSHGFILFFCIILLQLYTMIQRIDYNTRKQ